MGKAKPRTSAGLSLGRSSKRAREFEELFVPAPIAIVIATAVVPLRCVVLRLRRAENDTSVNGKRLQNNVKAAIVKGLRRWPIWPLPTAPCNPVDTSDVADYLAGCLDDGKRGMRDEIGGPDLMSFAEFGRQFQRAAGFYRPILPIPVSEKMASNLGFVRTKEGRGQSGKKTWAEWLNSESGFTT